jgi:hypothetical protein
MGTRADFYVGSGKEADWSEAPEDAKWWDGKGLLWWKKSSGGFCFFSPSQIHWVQGDAYPLPMPHWVERPNTPKSIEGDAMNNEQLIQHIKDYRKELGWECKDDADILETLQVSGAILYREGIEDRRWWKEVFYVVDIAGVSMGYSGAETTGDDSPYDKGWEFDTASICEVERKVETKTVVSYVRRKGEV